MKKIVPVLFVCLLSSLASFAQSVKYALQIKTEEVGNSTKPSFLVVHGDEGHNFVTIQVTKSASQFNLDSFFSYPQPATINYYPDCDQDEIKDLKSSGRSYKPSLDITFFITDTINALVVKKDTILLLTPNLLQKKYQKIGDDMDVRIALFNKNGGDELQRAFKQSKIQREKDSIRHLSDNIFKTNVARPNLDSTVLPAIQNNLDNPVSLYAISEYLFIARALELSIPVSTLQTLLASMPEQQKQYKIWKELDYTMKNMRPAKTFVGMAAPEFIDLKDTSGRTVYLKDLKGKVVFVDFWASWCTPCKAQLPQLKNIYHGIQDKNVAFVGISFDTRLSDLKDEIKRSGLTWVNVTDLQVEKGTTAIKYNVVLIPHNFLIDKNGIIVGEEIPVDKIEAKIKELL